MEKLVRKTLFLSNKLTSLYLAPPELFWWSFFIPQSFCAIRTSVNFLIAFANTIRLSADILIASASALIVFCRTHPPSPVRMLEGVNPWGGD